MHVCANYRGGSYSRFYQQNVECTKQMCANYVVAAIRDIINSSGYAWLPSPSCKVSLFASSAACQHLQHCHCPLQSHPQCHCHLHYPQNLLMPIFRQLGVLGTLNTQIHFDASVYCVYDISLFDPPVFWFLTHKQKQFYRTTSHNMSLSENIFVK